MEFKELGTRHGTAIRATLEAARHRAQGVIGRWLQVTEYTTGFAQGLLRPNA
jgi:hypothetical protein